MEVVILHYGINFQSIVLSWEEFANYAGRRPVTVEVCGSKLPYDIFRTIYNKGAEHALNADEGLAFQEDEGYNMVDPE